MSSFRVPRYCGSGITIGHDALLSPSTTITQLKRLVVADPLSTLSLVTSKLRITAGKSVTSTNMAVRCLAASSTGTSASEKVELQEAVDRIVAKQTKTVLYVTGGGASAIKWILSTPGASGTILNARVPYAAASLTELLGYLPSQYASRDVAVAMAKVSYREAANLAEIGVPITGVGCTCALRTNYEKKGDHKVFVAAHSGSSTQVYSLRLNKGSRTRSEEDDLAGRIVVTALASVNNVPCDVLSGHLDPGTDSKPPESLQVETLPPAADPIHLLLNGAIESVEFSGGQVYVDAPRRRRLYLPGSFNPLHEGHQQMLEAAKAVKVGMEGVFEFSIGNADKGLLPEEEIKRRVSQFVAQGVPVVVTQAPLFTQKAELFPGSCFVVGYDTAVRLVRPEYYGNDTAMLLQFAKLVYRGCSFLVAGRVEGGTFKTLADVDIPASLQREGLFEGVPEELFRKDISSTELREKGLGLVSAT